MNKNVDRSYLVLFGIAGAVIYLDQWTKALVRENIPFGTYWSPWDWLEPYARIVFWQNTGAAFGIFQGFNLVFSILAVLVALAILYYFPMVPAKDWYLRGAMCLQFAGAVGNLIDRIARGWVTDFISIGSFAVFNIADASITTGVVILVLGLWFKDRLVAKAEAENEEKEVLPEAVKSEEPEQNIEG